MTSSEPPEGKFEVLSATDTTVLEAQAEIQEHFYGDKPVPESTVTWLLKTLLRLRDVLSHQMACPGCDACDGKRKWF